MSRCWDPQRWPMGAVLWRSLGGGSSSRGGRASLPRGHGVSLLGAPRRARFARDFSYSPGRDAVTTATRSSRPQLSLPSSACPLPGGSPLRGSRSHPPVSRKRPLRAAPPGEGRCWGAAAAPAPLWSPRRRFAWGRTVMRHLNWHLCIESALLRSQCYRRGLISNCSASRRSEKSPGSKRLAQLEANGKCLPFLVLSRTEKLLSVCAASAGTPGLVPPCLPVSAFMDARQGN